GCRSKAATTCSIQSGSVSVSLLSRMTISPCAACIAALHAPVKPRFSPSASVRTSGYCASRSACEPSVEASSATITSTRWWVCRRSESRQVGRKLAPFQFGMTMETRGVPAKLSPLLPGEVLRQRLLPRAKRHTQCGAEHVVERGVRRRRRGPLERVRRYRFDRYVEPYLPHDL